MRALILGLFVIAGLVLAFAWTVPEDFQALGSGGIARLVYLLGALLLVGGGLSGAAQGSPRRGPGILGSLLIWAAIFAVVAVAYRAAWIWAGLINLLAGLSG